MTTPERPGTSPYDAVQPEPGQRYVEPPIVGMPYNGPSMDAQPYYAPPIPVPQYQPVPYQQPFTQPYPQYPQAAMTNGMAIAAMVLGILWLYWVGSILALIFGYVARDQIKRTGQSGDGMAIAGIVLGWVGVGFLVLGVLVAAST
jgi:hypothetical protein